MQPHPGESRRAQKGRTSLAPSAIPEVFVLWHPSCPDGEKLARRLLQWFRPGNGLGPEVFFRSLPAPHAPLNGLPPPLPGEDRPGVASPVRPVQRFEKLQVVLPLVDEHMVADASWRYWLEHLARNPSGAPREIFPVALDSSAYNLPQGLSKLNYLRPTGLPLMKNGGNSAFEIVARSLLKQATEALCRLVLPRPANANATVGHGIADAPPPKINIFLSHAKADGAKPARRLRDYIYSQTQLAAFFDENDIAYGAAFSRMIALGVNSPDTAALIAVRSVKYASRPWCRREFSLFRRARPISTAARAAQRWFLYPALVVEAMTDSEPTLGVPEFGGAPAMQWIESDANIEERIVMTVIRDAMLASFHATLGAVIPSHRGQIVINWLPDATTLLGIPQVQRDKELDILHPGSGLSGLELDILSELFPRLTFRSFEEALL
jgi:hypothetical protein